jgi:dsRNA-specific ribonuclease
MNKQKKARFRKINTIGSEVGKHREELYRQAYCRIRIARENGYWLEVIAICDSIIGDRFEALVAAINNQVESGRKLRTISQIIKNHGPKIVKSGVPQSFIDELVEWLDYRNRFMHEIVKVRESEISSWKDRLKLAEETAKSGVIYSRRIDKITKPLIIKIRNISKI